MTLRKRENIVTCKKKQYIAPCEVLALEEDVKMSQSRLRNEYIPLESVFVCCNTKQQVDKNIEFVLAHSTHTPTKLGRANRICENKYSGPLTYELNSFPRAGRISSWS
jgi:hypothetical protein